MRRLPNQEAWEGPQTPPSSISTKYLFHSVPNQDKSLLQSFLPLKRPTLLLGLLRLGRQFAFRFRFLFAVAFVFLFHVFHRLHLLSVYRNEIITVRWPHTVSTCCPHP